MRSICIYIPALFLSVVCFTGFTQTPVNDRKLFIGDDAPALAISQWIKGTPVTEFKKGNIYVVEFWATWCKPCIAGMPHVSELARKYKGQVTFLGVSIMERGDGALPAIEKLVAKMGSNMDYNVAAESGKLMTQTWLNAFGERGIPYSIVIDQQGKVAWGGMPAGLGNVLPVILSGKWDINAARDSRAEYIRLNNLDRNEVVNTMNRLIGKPDSAVVGINKILAANPGLKYFPNTGHFIFFALIKTAPLKAEQFAREWFAAAADPRYSSITDAIAWSAGKGITLPTSLYTLAADSYQAQLDKYPWSMNFPATYKEMAGLYKKAGNEAMAAEFLKKADTYRADGQEYNH